MALTVGFFLTSFPLRADNPVPATPDDVHKILREALGDGPDSAPPPEQQRALVSKALKVIERVPHVYHGELMRAAQDMSAALEDLARDGGASKARGEILDADDLIRSIM
jgi:hypothetical protein